MLEWQAFHLDCSGWVAAPAAAVAAGPTEYARTDSVVATAGAGTERCPVVHVGQAWLSSMACAVRRLGLPLYRLREPCTAVPSLVHADGRALQESALC